MAASLLAWEAIHQLAEQACKRFALRWPVTFQPLARRSTKCRTYGECEYDHCPTCRCAPIIRLALVGRTGRPLSRAAIMAVLAHELGHLRHIRHGRPHAALTREIVAYLRDQHAEPVTPHMLVIPAKR